MNRYKASKRAGLIGIICNIFLFIIKFIVGLTYKSQSMIADSMNSLGDIFSSFMTWLGNKISSVPRDNDHNYGHGKAEYIFSMLISISMMIVALKLLYEGVMSIINRNILVYDKLLIIVCIITIITKLCLYIYTKLLYKKYDNLLLKSNMLDHRNDCFVTTFSLIAIVLSNYGIHWFDGIVGIGISIWIFITGVKIYIESYNVLMDASIDKESKNKMLEIISNEKNKDLIKIGNLYSVPVGYHYIVVLTIFVNGKLTTEESHSITEKLEKKIQDNVERIEKIIIHVEPYDKKKDKDLK